MTAPAPAKVGKVTVKFAGDANAVGEQVVRANMQLREGIEFEPNLIDHDIHSLVATGFFEPGGVDIQPSEGLDHRVDIVVLVTPKLRVQAVRYEGNSQLSSGGFLSFGGFGKEIKTKPGDPLDERQVHVDAQTIRDYYQQAGYNQAKVDTAIERNRATGFGTVVFKITEGTKVNISSIRFTGNDHLKATVLLKQMETQPRGFWSWLSGSGRLKDEPFEDDLAKLRDYYLEQGFLDVVISSREKVGYDYPTPSKLVITIPITEGRQYKVGAITITGNTLIAEAKLRPLLTQTSGSIFTPSKLDKDVEALEDAYGVLGYLETRVQRIRKPNLETGNIDLEYAFTEGEKFQVESVHVEGNTKTKSLVIIRELNLGPGDVFDTVRMKSSQQKLRNTGFFEDVNISPETTPIPGRKNVKIVVKEGQTGALNFGAGISSLERVVVYAEITQGNFDLFNRRSLYQGAGQKFRLRLQLGTRSSEVLLSFEEPWLFQHELALGFSVFRTSADYNSALYDEIRTGGEIYLRKMLFPKQGIEGRLAYSYQVVEINNVDPAAPAVIKALAGQETISKVGLTLTRDTRDKLLNTTRGNRGEVTLELAGGPFGGGADYYRVEARGSQFIPVFAAQTQVLAVIGRLGVIENYGRSAQVPFFDRNFLGGPYTLRGFSYRTVGPKDPSGEPIGGKTYGLATLEYSFEIFPSARLAFFYDAGFVNANAYDFSASRYNDDFGFGLRLLLGGAPLNLDFGFPITSDAFNDKGMQFNFSVGTRF